MELSKETNNLFIRGVDVLPKEEILLGEYVVC